MDKVNLMKDILPEPGPLFEIDEFRVTRNRLLSQSDQMMIEDRPTDKESWKAYRQQLRDLPETEGWPNNIEWPAVPKS